MDDFDVVIIGAGVWGLRCLKTWLDIHPDANILAIDSHASIGGTWCAERLYLGLKSNNLKGTYEFSDFPMTEEQFGVKPYQHIPGVVMHRYLKAFCDKFDLHRRVRLNTAVETVDSDDNDGWILSTVSREAGDPAPTERKIRAQKLIVATGQTSQPMMPDFPGKDSFNGRILHSVDIGTTRPPFTPAKSVAIYGGGKSAWDTAYACATATDSPPEIHMIIRRTGFGAHWFSQPFVTPLKVWLERFLYTRATTWLGPSIWGDEDGYGWARAFLHRTWLGQLIVSAFWGIIRAETEAVNGYDKHPDTAKLKPRIAPFWVGTGISILNYDSDFFALVRAGRIRVHAGDIARLAPGAVHLAGGETVAADTLVCCTGWQYVPGAAFRPTRRAVELGLPGTSALVSDAEARLARAADADILARFPMLRDQPVPPVDPASGGRDPAPPVSEKQPSGDGATPRAPGRPYRLWRFMVPVGAAAGPAGQRNVAFAGMMASLQTSLHAHVQALWITSFLDGSLDVARCMAREQRGAAGPLRERVEYQTMLHTQFGRWRVPGGLGARFPDLAFDGLPYVDLLMRDLGLNPWRKSLGGGPLGGWLPNPREWFSTYTWSDYGNLSQELLVAREGKAKAV